jgi:hypothetical protein
MSNRTYELIYVLKPDAPETEVADMHKQVADIVERLGGTIDKTENAAPWAAAGWPTRSVITKKASTSSK